MIVDKTTIYLQSGRGGEANSTLKSLSARKVVGSGGDGGKGADVILKVSPHLYDLSKFRGNKKFIAPNGGRGRESNKKGRDAENLIVSVPLGTLVLDKENLIVDLAREKEEFLICRGGKGGKGNYKRDYTLPPEDGEGKEVALDYRIVNDAAILGFANSGKTSFFNALTGQDSKVAHYAFTTSSCFWAKSELDFEEITILDTPAFKRRKDPDQIIENKFLRHIFRSKIILLLSDDPVNYQKDFSELKQEVTIYDFKLLENKKVFYLLTKADKIDKKQVENNVCLVSAKDGIEEFKERVFKELLGE